MGHCHNVLLVSSPIEGMTIDQIFGQLNQLISNYLLVLPVHCIGQGRWCPTPKTDTKDLLGVAPKIHTKEDICVKEIKLIDWNVLTIIGLKGLVTKMID
jgi:hypothetical protein